MLHLHLWIGAGYAAARVSWALLTLVAISLASMPLTQQLWTWDRFLHGGQDFETGAFLILISFCLIVVLAHACKSCIARLLAAIGLLAPVDNDSARSSRPARPYRALLRNTPFRGGYTLPLQI